MCQALCQALGYNLSHSSCGDYKWQTGGIQMAVPMNVTLQLWQRETGGRGGEANLENKNIFSKLQKKSIRKFNLANLFFI